MAYPVLVEFNLSDGSDEWLREQIRLDPQTHRPRTQRVIVQNAEEAHRLVLLMPKMKSARHRPYGGAWSQRLEFVA